jgi:microcystin-dependent protein
MADQTVWRLLQGEGIALVEDPGTKSVTVSVPGLASKLNTGDIVQATQLQAGIAEIATSDEVRAGTDPDRIVTPAGLAAAAQATLDDATASRLMRVGGFGLGGAARVLTGANLNAERPTGFYYCVTCTNGPISNAELGDGWLIHRDHSVSGYASQTYESGVVDRAFFRRQVQGTWSSWREIYHTGNFDPGTKANTSGDYPSLNAGQANTVWDLPGRGGPHTAQMLAPSGMCAYFAMATPPTGWLAANGALVSRATYAALFAAIGTTYGAGNGSSTFSLPDLRGMFPRAWDAGRGVDPGRVLGTSQGSANLSHQHSMAGAGAHNHSMSSAGAHQHSVAEYAGGSPASLHISAATNSGLGGGLTGSAGAHTHTITDAGSHTHTITSEGASESRPINVALLACIKY